MPGTQIEKIRNAVKVQLINAPWGEYYKVTVPKRVERKWDAIKRTHIEYQAGEKHESVTDVAYRVNTLDEALTIVKIILG